jgi:hypothetical protein
VHQVSADWRVALVAPENCLTRCRSSDFLSQFQRDEPAIDTKPFEDQILQPAFPVLAESSTRRQFVLDRQK